MKRYNKIPLYQDVIRGIPEDISLCEMRDFDFRFLLGILEEFKPKRLVEIGIAAGVTTAVVIKYLEEHSPNSELISIDKSNVFYRDKSMRCGFYAEHIKSRDQISISHKLLVGDISATYIDSIGMGVDFLFLDTTHFLPGELLDLIALLPLLKDGAIVVLHDVGLSHVQLGNRNAVSTKVIFDIVSARKYYMEDSGYGHGLANIAAFQVSEDTRDNVEDLFSALMLGWDYLPSHRDLRLYGEVIDMYYDKQLMQMYENAVYWQSRSVSERLLHSHYDGDLDFLKKRWKDAQAVYIYGCGYWGNLYHAYAVAEGLPIKGMVVSDASDITPILREEYSCPIYSLQEIVEQNQKCIVVFAMSDENKLSCRKLVSGYANVEELI